MLTVVVDGGGRVDRVWLRKVVVGGGKNCGVVMGLLLVLLLLVPAPKC